MTHERSKRKRGVSTLARRLRDGAASPRPPVPVPMSWLWGWIQSSLAWTGSRGREVSSRERERESLKTILASDKHVSSILSRFSLLSSQGNLKPTQQQQEAHSRSSRGSCHARRRTLPSPPWCLHRPIYHHRVAGHLSLNKTNNTPLITVK